MSDPRDALAVRLGILPRYTDLAGQDRPTVPETRDALLRAMGYAPEAAAEALAGLAAADAARDLPPWLVVETGADVTVPLAAAVVWTLTLEDGQSREGRGAALGRLALGIHRLEVAGAVTWLLAAPPRLPEPPHAWGVTLPLYGLRPAEVGGVGSYADLASAVTSLQGAGADFVGINPVHAGFPEDHAAFSPYSPSHRRRLNTLHIDAGAAAAPGALIDYATAIPAQKAALERLFTAAPLPEAFRAWRQDQGAALQRFALHQTLSELHGPYWDAWPAAFRDSKSPEVAAVADARAGRVTFHAWAQWLAETQLDAARAAGAAMRFGLYLDLAVGTHPAGAETWADPGHFATGVSLGAPPDAFAADGQSWTLAPFRPQALAADGFRALAETLRAQLRFARLLRIDHILGFKRAFWVPEGGIPGAYVDMPTAAMLAVARIEAARAGATIIGEDLGNVPDGLRARLAASGILGCRVAMFEQHHGPSVGFKAAEEYDRAALTSFATHDLPTFKGWRAASDIGWRQRLGAIDHAEADAQRRRRTAEVAAFAAVAGHSQADLNQFLGRTPSRLVALQIEDILDQTEQPNLPGTVAEHPNWRRRLPVAADALGEQPAMQAAGRAMTANGRGKTHGNPDG